MKKCLHALTASALAAGLAACATPRPSVIGEVAEEREVVVLLHGLARSSRSMDAMEQALAADGYTVCSLNYSSRTKTVEQIASEDLAPLIKQCEARNPRKIHFVAHSLGNIVLRQYLASHTLEHAGRIVMLGPPNHGSEVVDKLGSLTLFEWITGPAGQQLGTSSNSLPNRLPVPAADVGVIAGTETLNPFLSTLIPGPDDGKVAVEQTKLEGMDDFATVAASHPFLMTNDQAIRLTLEFLRHGSFTPPPPNSP